MSARTWESWHLLGYDEDPCPGSEYFTRLEGNHYVGVADDIEDQVSRLRRLADPDDRLEGDYVDGLQDSCNDLAGHLDKLEGRFRTTGNQLVAFADDIATVRSRTQTAVDSAASAASGEDLDELWPGRPMMPPPEDSPLHGPWSSARSAMGTFDDRAEDVAKAIEDASDDDMKDSFWDKFKNAVSAIAPVLDFLADALGWIVVALVILSLFIPGLNVLTAALLLSLLALGIHTLLAATGNGSWVDVAWDVFAIATLGLGAGASRGVQAIGRSMLSTAGRQGGRRAAAQFLARGSFNGGSGVLGKLSMIRNLFSSGTLSGMRGAYQQALRGVTSMPLPGITRGTGPYTTRLLASLRAGGDPDIARQMLRMDALRTMNLSPGILNTVNLGVHTLPAHLGNIGSITSKVLDPDVGTSFDPYDIDWYSDLGSNMTTIIGGPY